MVMYASIRFPVSVAVSYACHMACVKTAPLSHVMGDKTELLLHYTFAGNTGARARACVMLRLRLRGKRTRSSARVARQRFAAIHTLAKRQRQRFVCGAVAFCGVVVVGSLGPGGGPSLVSNARFKPRLRATLESSSPWRARATAAAFAGVLKSHICERETCAHWLLNVITQ